MSDNMPVMSCEFFSINTKLWCLSRNVECVYR